jgi:alkylhydroperoxidase family enzyme
MSHIEPVPLDQLPAALGAAVARGRGNRMLGSTLPVQVWAHRPDAALAWLATLEQFHSHGVLEARLRELVRLRVAAITNCKACRMARKSDAVSEEDVSCLSSDNARFSAAEQAALVYAELFAGDYQAIDESVFARLKLHFSTPEIVELNMFCALMLAGGRMTFVQRAFE